MAYEFRPKDRHPFLNPLHCMLDAAEITHESAYDKRFGHMLVVPVPHEEQRVAKLEAQAPQREIDEQDAALIQWTKRTDANYDQWNHQILLVGDEFHIQYTPKADAEKTRRP